MFLTCTYKNSVNVGGCTNYTKITLSLFVDVSLRVCASVASSGMSSSNGLVALLFVVSRNNASAVWRFMPMRCKTSKSNSDKQRRHQVSLSMESAKLRIHFSASRSAEILNR